MEGKSPEGLRRRQTEWAGRTAEVATSTGREPEPAGDPNTREEEQRTADWMGEEEERGR